MVDALSKFCKPEVCRRTRWNFYYVTMGVKVLKLAGIDPGDGRGRFTLAQGVIAWFGKLDKVISNGELAFHSGRLRSSVPVQDIVVPLVEIALGLRREGGISTAEVLAELDEHLDSMLAARVVARLPNRGAAIADAGVA